MEPCPSPIPSLSVRLFGPFDVRVGGCPLPRLRTSRGRSLLALLLLRREAAVDRLWLAGALWPDSDEDKAAANLRRALNDLRHALGPEAVRIRGVAPRSLCIELAGASVDVIAFDAAVRRGDPESLESAVNSYRGPLMEGCTESWVFPEREWREQACIEALEKLAQGAMAREGSISAVSLLRRAIKMDPLREHLYGRLMEALEFAGDFAAAEQVYRDLRGFLHREMNVEPSQDTKVIYARIKARSQCGVDGKTRADLPALPTAPPLPQRMTPLLGRENEVRELLDRLASWRLVTIIGPGGSGKTSLAVEVARAMESQGEVRFAGLASLEHPSFVGPAIAAALDIQEHTDASLADAISKHLRDQKTLLLLDNCEHVLDGCRAIAQALLGACKGLRILATSRQPLGLEGELVWELGPLAVPIQKPDTLKRNDGKDWLSYSAVRLFVERARQIERRFSVDDSVIRDIVRICQMLEGLPLAIELAAAWIGALTPSEIQARLSEPLTLLVDRRPTTEARHKSVSATAAWSYHLLAPELQILFARLSVFSGGWTLDAAQAVCGATLSQMAALRDRSLVNAQPECQVTRFRMLYPIRAFAMDRLAPYSSEEVARSHAFYYLRLAEQAEPELSGPQQAHWLNLLDKDGDNLRAAIAFAVQCGDVSVALRLGASLGPFWWTRGYWTEGRRHLEAILALVDEALLADKDRAAYGLALYCSGWLAVKQGEEQTGKIQLDRALGLLKAEGHLRGTGRCLVVLGGLAIDHYELNVARALLTERLTLRENGLDDAGAASAVYGLGRAAMHEYDYNAAREFFVEALLISTEASDSRGIASALMALGVIAGKREEATTARGYLNDALALYTQLGERRGIAFTLTNTAENELAAGNHTEARKLADQGLEMWRELGQPYGIADALFALAVATYRCDDVKGSLPLYAEASQLYRQVNDLVGLARVLVNVAMQAEIAGDMERSMRLCGAADAFAAGVWDGAHAYERDAYDRITESARRRLGPAQAEIIWREGRRIAGNRGAEFEKLLP